MLVSHYNLQSEKEGEGEGEDHVSEVTVEEIAPEEVYARKILTNSEISVRLSMLGKTAEGDGYTYLKAVCTNLSVNDISAFLNFKHLNFIDVSNNLLTLDALQVLTKLPFLVFLQADKNLLNSAALNITKYLQVLVMNNNKIVSVQDVYQPELCTLELGYNTIERIHFNNEMREIKCLDFRYNVIKDISNLKFPNLDSLYLAGNKITELDGLKNLLNLRILHVRNNPIKLLNGFVEEHTKLQYINLRNCKVVSLKQIKKLRVLTALETLVIRGCPYMGGAGVESTDIPDEEDDGELRVEVLATLPRLKKLNKSVPTPEERTEALDLMKTWLEEGEKEDEEEEEIAEELEKVE